MHIRFPHRPLQTRNKKQVLKGKTHNTDQAKKKKLRRRSGAKKEDMESNSSGVHEMVGEPQDAVAFV
jgi:hypothetical protein